MKLLITVLGLFLTITLTAQKDTKSIMYRATKSRIVALDPSGNFWMTGDWIKTNALIALDLEKNQMTIYGEVETKLNIVKTYDDVKDAYGQTWIRCNALTSDNKKCNIRMVLFNAPNPDKSTTSIYIDYTTTTLVFDVYKE